MPRPGGLVRAAEALEALHRFGLLHGDLGAGDVIVPRERLFRRGRRSRGVVLCDPAWWPLEGAGDALASSARAGIVCGGDPSPALDLHALGRVFYRVLTGLEPEATASGFPPPVGEVRADLPIDLQRIAMRLLHPDPARRYRRARDLLEDLDRGTSPRGASRSVSLADTFVGRGRELARAIEALAGADRPLVLAVSGEGGSGKSAFLGRLRLEGELRDRRVASVRCFRTGGSLLGPLRELIERLAPVGASGRALRRRARALLEVPEPELDREPGREGAMDLLGEEEPAWNRESLLGRAVELLLEAASGTRIALFLDDVHLASPLSIAFLSRLVRELALPEAARGRRAGPRPRLVLAFRSEPPFRAALRPLRDALEGAGEIVRSIELGPLEPAEIESWVERALADLPGISAARRSLAGASCVKKALPLLAREALRASLAFLPSPSARAPAETGIHAMYEAFVESLDAARREVLEACALLGRPASGELLATLAARRAPVPKAIPRALCREGILVETGGMLYFQHDSLAGWIVERLAAKRRGAWHRRIAVVLAERGDSGVQEIARHWLEADSPGQGWRSVLQAARACLRRHDARDARDLYRRGLELAPETKEDLREGIVEELAEASARLGEHREATDLLVSLVHTRGDPAERAALHARIGRYLHAAGEDEEATGHFEAALELLPAGGNAPEAALITWLRTESELAEIAAGRGEHDRAESICHEALERVERSEAARPSREVAREEMVLTETLAHIRLKRFQYAEARELFSRSLRISRELGAAHEESQILNNLGILCLQEDRFAEAIRCYRRAEALARRRRDDATLLAVACKLAILHAKTGDLEDADRARVEAARCAGRRGSSRARLLYVHTAGLVDLAAGRYASAAESFRESVRLSAELHDAARAAFDLVYLGECSLFRNEPKAALVALSRAREGSPPAGVERMVAARAALLYALRDDRAAARRSLGELDASGETSPAPGLDAWNRLYAGWARRRIGEPEAARGDLEAARDFFRARGIPAGEIHAELELAALEGEAGRAGAASARLRRLERRFACGRGPLAHPMLAARWLIYGTWVRSEAGEEDASAGLSALVEAESYLIGRRFPDLESLAIRLRQRFYLRGLDAAPDAAAPRRAGGDARDHLEVGALRALRDAAEALVARLEADAGVGSTRELRTLLSDYARRLEEHQREREARRLAPGDAVTTEAIIGRSPAMRSLAASVRRLALADVPVLITGETGAGKELVARALHGESRRAGRPFVSLAAAALPEELIEAELFGHREGAFTGAEASREGLLVAAAGGSVFLDEVADLSLGAQAKILRLLDRPAVRPLGDVDEVPIDVRFLFSTNRELEADLDERRFRRDLYYRLSAFELRVPPLRERPEDLPLLVEHFAREARASGPPVRFESDALAALAAYPWPGNVRELRGAVLRLALTGSRRVRASDVRRSLERRGTVSIFSPALLRSRPLPELARELEREYLRVLGADCGGDLADMAERLGLRRRALYDRLKKAGIRPRELRGRPGG